MTEKMLQRKHKTELAHGEAVFGKIGLPIQKEITPFIPHLMNYQDHGKLLETIAYAVTADMPVLLIGETGVGKTAAVRHMAARTRNSLRRVNVNGSMTAEDFVGQLIVRDGATVWEDGVLTEAMRKGWWLVVDEINAASAEVLFVLHSLLDDDRFVQLTGKPDREVVKAHANFRMFATMNPPERYAGTKDMNKALLSRFAVTLEVPIPPPSIEIGDIANAGKVLNEKQQTQLKNFLSEVRGAYHKEELETFISPRDVQAMVKMLAFSGSIGTALELTVLPRGTKSEQKAIRDMARLHFTTKEDEPSPKAESGAVNSASPLKVGDRVIGVGTFQGREIDGLTGKILAIEADETHSVEFDTSMGGHTCAGLGKKGHCWNVPPGHLKHATKVKEWIDAQVGDQVRVTKDTPSGYKAGQVFRIVKINVRAEIVILDGAGIWDIPSNVLELV